MNDESQREERNGNEEELEEEDILEVISLPDEEENSPTDAAGDDMMEMAAEVEERREDSKLVFAGHAEEVFSVDCAWPLVASGGKDDRALVWSVEDGQTKLECGGHKDSVVFVRFNHKKTLVATGDMSGLVKVWTLASGDATDLEHSADLEWLCWHWTADILFVGVKDGTVWMWLVPTGTCKILETNGFACTAGSLLADGKHLVAGHGNGTVRVWDLKAATYRSAANDTGAAITCVHCQDGGAMAVVGAEDGSLTLFHVSSAQVCSVFQCGEDKSTEEPTVYPVESVQFSPDGALLAAGTLEGGLELWELQSGLQRHKCPHPSGLVKIYWLNNHQLVTGCLDGVLRLWDARDGQLVREFHGHHAEILDFAVSADSRFLVSAAADATCRVFPMEDNQDL